MNLWSIIFVCFTLLILSICAFFDAKNNDKVPFWLFFAIPMMYFIVTICYQNPIDWKTILFGGAISIPFFVLAFLGKCGGADAIMIACIGVCYGPFYTALWIGLACVIFVISMLIKAKKAGLSFKQSFTSSAEGAFIPSSAISFAVVSAILMIIQNHMI